MIELRYEWRAQDDTANSLNDLFDLSLGVVAIGGPGAGRTGACTDHLEIWICYE